MAGFTFAGPPWPAVAVWRNTAEARNCLGDLPRPPFAVQVTSVGVTSAVTGSIPPTVLIAQVMGTGVVLSAPFTRSNSLNSVARNGSIDVRSMKSLNETLNPVGAGGAPFAGGGV